LPARLAPPSIFQSAGRQPQAGSPHAIPGAGYRKEYLAQEDSQAAYESRHSKNEERRDSQRKIRSCDGADKAGGNQQADEQGAQDFAGQRKVNQPKAAAQHLALAFVPLKVLPLLLVQSFIQHAGTVYSSRQAVDEYAYDGRNCVEQKHWRDRQLDKMSDIAKA
jgi:hypothetical protein